jgi:hypothetical protein
MKVGRYIVFCDLPKNSIAGAQVQSAPDFVGAAIFLPKSKINPSTYSPFSHDPLIAHEATHLDLWATGWSMVDCVPKTSERDHYIVGMLANLLSDPIINSRISKLGFHIEIDRANEIANSIHAISQGIWNVHAKELILGDLHAIRLFVSFSLEPNIPPELIQIFQERFKSAMPLMYDKAWKLLQLIQASGFDNPEKYKTTFYKCLQYFGLQRDSIVFEEPFIRFDENACKDWAEENAFPPEESWE